MSETNTSASPSSASPAEHKPFIPDSESPHELTIRALIVGTVLGIVFGASSLYLVLKIGMTVSASIPVAVLSITLFKALSKMFGIRRATILENNIVQTTGSAGESIAFGVGVTMPALMLLGYEMDIGRVMTVAILGGLLGILMMIPLRRAFIVKKHGELKYPEGTACADVLIVGEQAGTNAKMVFAGFGLAFVYQIFCKGMKLWDETMAYPLDWFKKAKLSMDADPTLLGVGYIIGPRIAAVMTAGGVLAYLVFVPAIRFFGEKLTTALYPGTKLISEMSDSDIRTDYILYIGAGAVATGGIIAVFQALPLIIASIQAGLSDVLKSNKGGAPTTSSRTDRDMPLSVVMIGSLLLVLAIWSTSFLHGLIPGIPDLNMNFLGASLILIFGFLFVTVSSRLTGEVGSSSNPISGMMVATLLLTCLIFLLMGWTGADYRLTALSIGAIVCIAASNGGTTSQDLKTGYLVGATPRAQQVGILIGALTSALVIGYSLIILNETGTIYTKKDLPKPAVAIDIEKLTEKFVIPKGDDKTEYYVWHAREGDPQKVPAGKYLVEIIEKEAPKSAKPADKAAPKTDDKSSNKSPAKSGEKTPPKTGEKSAEKSPGKTSEKPAAKSNEKQADKPAEKTGEKTAVIRYLVDPSINGVRTKDDDGVEIKRFDAPKARLMQLITDGILTQKLEWTLVLLGAFIALVMELCGVPALPFAVGVYLPLSASTPIFLGGAIRWLADYWSKRKGEAPVSELESEMKPGTLCATGFVAGGSIAAVLVSFLQISDDIPHYMSRWQYQTYNVRQEADVNAVYESIAGVKAGLLERDPVYFTKERIKATDDKFIQLEIDQSKNRIDRMTKEGKSEKELDQERSDSLARQRKLKREHAKALATLHWLEEKIAEIKAANATTEIENIRVEKGEVIKLPRTSASKKDESKDSAKDGAKDSKEGEYVATERTTLGAISEKLYGNSRKAGSLVDDNLGTLYRVKANSVVKLPDGKEYRARQELTIREVAKRALNDPEKFTELLEQKDNKANLKLLYNYGPGAKVKVPGSQWEIVIAFGILAIILTMAALGYLGADPEKK